MNKREFLEQRQPAWKRFEGMVDFFKNRVITPRRNEPAPDERSGKRPRESEIAEFSRLFRELSNDLATVRSRGWGEAVAVYLNDLLARGHNCFYSAPPTNVQLVVRYLTVDYPRLFRANIWYFVTAAALFFLPLGITWATVQHEPAVAERILPGEMLDQMKTMYGKDDTEKASDEGEGPARDTDKSAQKSRDHDRKSRRSKSWDKKFGEERTMMFGFYIRNNVGIAFQCFARGSLLGVGTVYTLLFNGIVIGAVAGFVCSEASAERFLAFVISHGSFELTAIAVAGGAGLMLGNAAIHPGLRKRVEAFPARALDAVQIAVGAGVMLVIAALIEAYWSPSGLPSVIKIGGGCLMWLSVFLYLGFAGRHK